MIQNRLPEDPKLRKNSESVQRAAFASARLLSLISHDIRSPLAAMALALQILETTSCTPEQRKAVRILKSSSQELLELVDLILDYSKIESGEVEFAEKEFDIRALIANTRRSLESKFDDKRLCFQVEVDDSVPACLVGDPIVIGQILTNLVSNVIKYANGGTVRLALNVREPNADAVTVEFSMKETGIALDRARLATGFEQFLRSSPRRAPKYGGTELGLAVCQKLLQLHGSAMHAESSPGQGSTLSFNLRLKRDHSIA